ncbi:aquaporin [Candidatus Saccharibacteria bacterium]|nr:aquaporin [Candidatus Saccharibacteria bacterium]
MAKSKKSGKKPKTAQSEKAEKLNGKAEKNDDKKTVKTEVVEKTEKVEKKETVKDEKVKDEPKKAVSSEKKNGFFKRFFAKKYTEDENILTIFKNKKVYGALLGEIFGTMFIMAVILTLGLYQLLYLFLILTVIYVVIHKLSGAQLNPIVTVGMMATRRMSAIRGVLYLLAQVVGAWLGTVIVNLFLSASGSENVLPSMTATPEGMFWGVTMIEFFGAAVIGFFYARAQEFKRSAFTFGAAVAGGTVLALVLVYVISANFFSLDGTFMLNPALALMYQILPQSANGVGELLAGIGLALLTYVIFPMVGGIVGFYLSDTAETLVEE